MCFKDMFFVVSLPFKMLTWTRLDANRNDVSKLSSTSTPELRNTETIRQQPNSDVPSVSVVVQPTSTYSSIYDECSCQPPVVKLSSSSYVSETSRQSSSIVIGHGSASTDCHHKTMEFGTLGCNSHPLHHHPRHPRRYCDVTNQSDAMFRSESSVSNQNNSHSMDSRHFCRGYPTTNSCYREINIDECLRRSQQIMHADDVSVASSSLTSSTSGNRKISTVNWLHGESRDQFTSRLTSHQMFCDQQRIGQRQVVAEVDYENYASIHPTHDNGDVSLERTRKETMSMKSFANDASINVNYNGENQSRKSTHNNANDEQLDQESSSSVDEKETGRRRVTDASCLQSTTNSTYIKKVVWEIVETERTYVRDLRQIIQGYQRHLDVCRVTNISTEDISSLFGNIEFIYEFNSQFLIELERCSNNPVSVAQCFVVNTEGFVIYSTYCSNYPRSVEVLTRCMKDADISAILRRQQLKLKHGLPLGSYLLKPVQRILKYHLLLQNLLDNHDRNESGYDVIHRALKGMVNVAIRINEMKRQHEKAVHVQEIQSRLYGWHGDDLTTLGDLILEDAFRMSSGGTRERRLVYLFDKALFIAKKKTDGSLLVKAFIECSNLLLVENVVKQPLSFQLVPFDAPRIQYTVQACKIEQKRLWCQHIRRLIVSEYNDNMLGSASCRQKRHKDSSAIQRLVMKRRRKVSTGSSSSRDVLLAQPNNDLITPVTNMYQERSMLQVLSENTAVEKEVSSQFVHQTPKNIKEDVEHEEIFPWPKPDLLNYTNSMNLQSNEENVETGRVLEDQSSISHRGQNADIAACSVSLGSRAPVCLDRTVSALRCRDSIALRKSKLSRSTTLSDAVLLCRDSLSSSRVQDDHSQIQMKELFTMSTDIS